MKSPKRMFIYTNDIQRLSGKSERYSRKIMSTLRTRLGKQKYQPVSIKEFCSFMNLSEEEVSKYIID